MDQVIERSTAVSLRPFASVTIRNLDSEIHVSLSQNPPASAAVGTTDCNFCKEQHKYPLTLLKTFKKMFMFWPFAVLVSNLLWNTAAGLSHGEPLIAGVDERQLRSSDSHVFMESIPQRNYRNDLQKVERVTNDLAHEVIFVIRQRNMAELTEILNNVSDPASVNYGKHMTSEEIASLTSNPDARDAVAKYLISSGATIVSETLSGEYVTANAAISVWETMFNTEFFLFHQANGNTTKKIVRAESYSIPINLHAHVDGVFNTIQMPLQPQERPSKPIQIGNDAKKVALDTGFMLPSKLRKFYNVGTTRGSPSSTQAIFGAIEQYFSPSDLRTFQRWAGLPLQAIASDIGQHTSDAVCLSTPETCAEANLDVQYIMASSPSSPTTYWYSDLSWSSWLLTVANTPKPPLVFSISYGQEEIYVSTAEKDAFNTQAIKLGAMGVTLVAASGDDGAVSRFTRNFGPSGCSYAPLFPASNPYVTAVGATSVRPC